MRRLIMTVTIFVLTSGSAEAEQSWVDELFMPVRLQNSTLSIPFSTVPIALPLQPLVEASVGLPLWDWGWGVLQQELGGGVYFQRSLFNSVHLHTQTTFQFRLPVGLFHAFQLGGAYARLFHPPGSIAVGEPETSFGLSAIQPYFGFALGYDGIREDTIPVRVALDYRVVFQYLPTEYPNTFGQLWPFTSLGLCISLPLGSWIGHGEDRP